MLGKFYVMILQLPNDVDVGVDVDHHCGHFQKRTLLTLLLEYCRVLLVNKQVEFLTKG